MSKMILIEEATVKLAIEALEAANRDEHRELVLEYREGVITALREAPASEAKEQPAPLTDTELINRGCHYQTELTQPAQQQGPCGWQFFQDGKWHNGMEINDHRANTEAAGVPVRDVYPSPQAQRKPLTDEQIDSIVAMSCKKYSSHLDAARVARAIEAAHGITKGGAQ